MPIKPLPIGAGLNLDADQTSIHDGSAVALVNFYFDRAAALRTVPGLADHSDVGTGIGVKTYEYFSKNFNTRIVVSAGRVWAQYSVDGPLTEITGGSLTAGVKPTFAEDINYIFVAADSYIHRISGATLTALGGNSPDHVTSLLYIGGYLMANGPDIPGDAVYSDDKDNDYELWEVYNNESKPDRLQTLMLVDSQYIYNIGPETLEVTFLGGDPANPFEVNRGRLSSFGTVAKYSPVYDGESLYYLSEITQSRKVIKNTGGVPTIISFPIDVPIEKFERIDNAEGFIMAFRGQNFYVLHFPSANCELIEQNWDAVTFAYHIQTKQWLILARWDAIDGRYEAYRGVCFSCIEPWNLRLIGDRNSGKTYRLYDDETVDYTTERLFQHRWRDNNSKTWGNYRNISLGTAGEYLRPADQYQGGQYLNRQHEMVYTDNTDAGEIYRACFWTGNISHQADVQKVNRFYRYNVKCGTNEFIVNSISESFEYRNK